MKIGVMAESFRTDFKSAVAVAKQLGANGMQAYASSFGADGILGYCNGDASKKTVAENEIKEVLSIIGDAGLCFSAICGDFGCDMYYTKNIAEIDREKRVIEIAAKLGTKIVTTHIGVVPDYECKQYDSMFEVYGSLARFAESAGCVFAVETGPEKSPLLKSFLDRVASKGAGVNLDPANLVMCAGEDPIEAVKNLKDYIVHTHAKDGVQHRPFDTRALYAPKHYDLEPAPWDLISEVPLGDGNVPWDGYIAALKEIGYDGFLTIEREVGDDPKADIEKAVKFLHKYI